MALLETDSLAKSFSGFVAVDSIDLSVEEGTVHSLIGPNGAGKTTCFNLLTGEYRPTSGSIFFDGEDITGRASHDRPYLGIGRSYQITNLYSGMTVEENLETAVSVFQSNYYDMFRPPGRIAGVDERVGELLEQLQLTDDRDTEVDALSYGDQRRLEIGMSLACDPELLLLDEPTAGMDQEETRNTMQLIQDLSAWYTLLLVEHDIEIVMSVSDEITVLHRGSILATGEPQSIRDNDEVQTVYLGGEADA